MVVWMEFRFECRIHFCSLKLNRFDRKMHQIPNDQLQEMAF